MVDNFLESLINQLEESKEKDFTDYLKSIKKDEKKPPLLMRWSNLLK